ncbi:hypothetical protein [Dyella sp. ASV21]|uniref:hypothetical protein n=1 Tax=Dyella sp. ASV21 TaxID=2795114 RepID=UPI0018EBAC93|nr:hypothetical protein [Dyella sp. ASV21]
MLTNRSHMRNGVGGVPFTTHQGWGRVLAGLIAWAFSVGVGAATIKTVVNEKPPLCGQLLDMIKAAGIPQMTNEQLCDFRFAQLPPSKTQGFTFPSWHEVAVADPASMYLKLIVANRPPHAPYGLPDLSKHREAANQAVRDHNLAFYMTTLSVSELTDDVNTSPTMTVSRRNLTFILMDIRHCSRLPYMGILDHPYHAAFESSDLQTPVPTGAISGMQIALWKNEFPVRIIVNDRWMPIGGQSVELGVDLENFWWHPAQGKIDAAMTGGTLCSFRIER